MFYPYSINTPTTTPTTEAKNVEIFTKLQKILKKFEGTHNFHNYTIEKKVGDKSCNRYILNMSLDRISHEHLVNTLKKQPKDEYFKVTLHGQSFVYHQIRKMIGMCIQIFQENGGDPFMIDNSFCANKIPVWLAPSEGLLLGEVCFLSFFLFFKIGLVEL
jgi:tRNA pseudouridine38-40 synthase